MAFRITRFDGSSEFLSNFYTGEGGDLTINGIYYPSSEHAFQAMKFVKRSHRRLVAGCATPGYAKRLARSKAMTPHLRAGWHDNNIRIHVMLYVLRLKFSHPIMREKLLWTRTRGLIEGNTWNDTYWGQCPVGEGENMLGRILMHIRTELQTGERKPFLIGDNIYG